MARRALHALAAGAVLGGSLLIATPAFADTCQPGDPYPCVTPGGGGGGTVSGGSGGGSGTTASGGGGGGTITGGNLPFTGAEILPIAGTAGALLVVGTTVLVAGRRRRPSTEV